MCSDTLNPGGEVHGCCVGSILGVPEVSPFMFIAASYQLHGISRTNDMLFHAEVFWVRRIFWCSDWHEIVIVFPLLDARRATSRDRNLERLQSGP